MTLHRLAVFCSFGAVCLAASEMRQGPEEPVVTLYSLNRNEEDISFTRLYAYTDLAPGYPDRLYVLFHGFTASANTSYVLQLANALFSLGEKDIIAVDCERATSMPYDSAVNNSLLVGREVADFFSTSSSSLRFVGISLGAHIAGIAAQVLRAENYITVERIIGLDPALPLFSSADRYHRLDAEDAGFVLVVHTDGGELGFLEPMGHADFYPNGGVNPQPQCTSRLERWIDILAQISCSHTAAVQYMTESVNGSLAATKCTSWEDFKNNLCAGWQEVDLGFNLAPNVRGMFYLRTRNAPPFGQSPDCSPYAAVENIQAISCSKKETNEDSALIALMIIATQVFSIWAIYNYYPDN